MQWIKRGVFSYVNFGKLALEGNLGRSHALIKLNKQTKNPLPILWLLISIHLTAMG